MPSGAVHPNRLSSTADALGSGPRLRGDERRVLLRRALLHQGGGSLVVGLLACEQRLEADEDDQTKIVELLMRAAQDLKKM